MLHHILGPVSKSNSKKIMLYLLINISIFIIVTAPCKCNLPHLQIVFGNTSRANCWALPAPVGLTSPSSSSCRHWLSCLQGSANCPTVNRTLDSGWLVINKCKRMESGANETSKSFPSSTCETELPGWFIFHCLFLPKELIALHGLNFEPLQQLCLGKFMVCRLDWLCCWSLQRAILLFY